MTAKGYATLPSEFDVEDESYVKPEIGSAFVPEGGWLLYDEGHMSVSNVEKVYPSEYVTAQEHVKGTPEEQEQAAKLAKTGDTTALVALGVGVIAVAAGVALVVARRRMKKNSRQTNRNQIDQQEPNKERQEINPQCFQLIKVYIKAQVTKIYLIYLAHRPIDKL